LAAGPRAPFSGSSCRRPEIGRFFADHERDEPPPLNESAAASNDLRLGHFTGTLNIAARSATIFDLTVTLTFYGIAAGLSLSLCLVLRVFAHFQPETLAVRSWSRTVCVLSLGFFGSGIGPALPVWATVVGTNLVLLSAGPIVHAGLCAYCSERRAVADRWGWGMVALTLPAFWYWGLYDPNGHYRSMVFSLAIVAVNGRTALLLARAARQGTGDLPIRLMAILFAVLTSWMVLRFAVLLVSAPVPAELRGANPTRWLTVFGYLALVSLMTVSVMWMETNRLKKLRGERRTDGCAELAEYFRNKQLLLWSSVTVVIASVVSVLGIGFVNFSEQGRAAALRGAGPVHGAMGWMVVSIVSVIAFVLLLALLLSVEAKRRAEHEQAERALRKSEQRLREAQSIGAIGDWEIDPEAGTVTFSQQMCSLLEIQADGKTLSLDEMRHYLLAGDLPVMEELVRRALEEGVGWEHDRQRVLPGGKKVWHHGVGKPVFDSQGKVIRIHGTTQDITARKETELALREREEQLHNLFENALVGIFHSNPQGGLLSANPALARMLGYDAPAELIAATSDMGVQIYAEPGQRAAIMGDLLSRDGWFHYERVPWKRKDGALITVDMNGRRVCNDTGELRYLEGFIADITERTLAEAKVHEITERWKTLEKCGAVLVINYLDEGRLYFSDGLRRLLGYDIGELDNWQTVDQWHGRLDPADVERIGAYLQANYQGCSDEMVFEHRVRCKDGSWKWLLVNGSVVRRDQDGRARIASGTLTDITHIRQMEEELKKRTDTLQDRVAEETGRRIFNEGLLTRSAKLAAMGEMIGAIAHQWRQPLATVGVILQNLQAARRLGKLDESYLEKAAIDANSQIRFMSETIDSFRNFFRPEKAKEHFDVIAKIEDATTFIRAQLRSYGIFIELPVREGAGLTVSGFPNEFTQVILNLLANARDAILEQRRLNPESPACIAVSAARVGESLVVEVSDTGCGLSPEVAQRLFEPYYTTKEEGEGTGIGLYMSRQIIEESMGGRLNFTTEPGATVFRIELPND
jgi:PAS domain S-box-containing protein